MRGICTFIILLLAPFFLPGQETFYRIYQDPPEQSGLSVVETGDEGFIFYSSWQIDLNPDTTLINCVDRSGSLLWSKKFGNSDRCYFERALCKITDNLYVFPTLYNDITCIVFINHSGDSLYSVPFPGVHIASITLSSDTCLIISSWDTENIQNSQIRLYKTKITGEQIWMRSFNYQANTHPVTALESTDHNIFLLAYGETPYWFKWPVLLRISSAGDSLWSKEVLGGIPMNDTFFSMDVTADNSCVIAGYSVAGSNGATLIKIDSTGSTVWMKVYLAKMMFLSCRVLNNGHIVMTTSKKYPDYTPYLFQTDNNGDSLWEQGYPSQSRSYGSAISVCKDGGYIVCGNVNDTGDFAFLMRTDSLGRIISPGIKDPIDRVITRFFPNPTYDDLDIEFQTAQSEIIVEVYTLSGQLVRTVPERGNTIRLTISLTGLVPAAYVVRVNSGATPIARAIIRKL